MPAFGGTSSAAVASGAFSASGVAAGHLGGTPVTLLLSFLGKVCRLPSTQEAEFIVPVVAVEFAKPLMFHPYGSVCIFLGLALDHMIWIVGSLVLQVGGKPVPASDLPV